MELESEASADEPVARPPGADRSWRTGGDVTGKIFPWWAVATWFWWRTTRICAAMLSLLSEDYRVVQTSHGGNVKDLVAEHEPDLVLLDWMMPGKDSLAVCRVTPLEQGQPRSSKSCLLTARIDENRITALRSGAG